MNGKENTGGGRRLRKRVTAKNTEAPPVAKTGKRKAPPRCRPPLHVSAGCTVRENLIDSRNLKCTLIISLYIETKDGMNIQFVFGISNIQMFFRYSIQNSNNLQLCKRISLKYFPSSPQPQNWPPAIVYFLT